MPDHFGEQLAPLAAMMAAADATESLRVGHWSSTTTTATPGPGKEMATIDLLSGAGWS